MGREKLAIEGGKPVRIKPFPRAADSTGRDIGEEELSLLREVIYSGTLWRNNGSKVIRFEKAFASFYGVENAVASTSGTAAIHVAVGAINPNPGDEIITTPLTDMGTVIPILCQNAIPVFADVDPRAFNIDPLSIEKNITSRTIAIIVVHIFGNAADMDPIMNIAEKYGLYVIEDCSQAYLTRYKGKLVGTIGDLGCFSLQQSKHITCGDGGITLVNNPHLSSRAKLFADKGWPREGGIRDHILLAPNYRMTELQGAVALAQLNKLEKVLSLRRKNAKLLTELLQDIPGVHPPYVPPYSEHSYWKYVFTIDEKKLKCTTKEFGNALREERIPVEIGAGYPKGPIFMCEMLKNKRTYGDSQFPWNSPYGRNIDYNESLTPVASRIIPRLLGIYWDEFFSEEDIKDIAHAIGKVVDYFLER